MNRTAMLERMKERVQEIHEEGRSQVAKYADYLLGDGPLDPAMLRTISEQLADIAVHIDKSVAMYQGALATDSTPNLY